MEQQHTTLEAMTWNSQNPNVFIGGEADSTLAWSNELLAADDVPEYQPIPANEPVPEGGLYGQVTYDDVVSYLNSFPTGYRFKPHDSELVQTYLAARIQGWPLPPNQIHEVKLYMFSPDDLSERYAPAGENEWYFFTSRDRKYKNGERPNRAARNGYWKATGADKAVILGDKKIGAKKSLVYYKGKPLKGVKSDWIMHEFSFIKAPKVASGGHDMLLDECVLCRLHRKPKRAEASPDPTPIRDDNDEQPNKKPKNKKNKKQNEPKADAPLPLPLPLPLPVEANQQQFQSDLPTLLPKQPNQQVPYMCNYDMGFQNGTQFEIRNFPDAVNPLPDCNMIDGPDPVLDSIYPYFVAYMSQFNQFHGQDWNAHQMVSPDQLPPPQPPLLIDDDPPDGHRSDDQK